MAEVAGIEDLYGLPLADFIPARDAKAKELRAAGHKEEAAEVKQARKPSLAAWALNQAARRHPDEVAGLLEAARALAEAQRAALAGDAGDLRNAGRALGEELDRVVARAAGFLEKASPVQQERMAATVRAAAGDPAGAELLRKGVLVEDLEPAGFGLEALAGETTLPPARRRTPPPKKTAVTEAVEGARRTLRRAEAEAEAAETRATRRAERAEAAARRAAEAHQEAESLRAEAEDAAGEAAAAQRRANEAAAALAKAEQHADAT